ncbi:hypothetical protein JOC77_001875 [Peribacillus deserti]|uniref:Uncharacterized protein n=1 Tax=Peribacillus deserti TaxID=673318 RepID=A0ABS2QHE2_9BACI|nr:hypothetical protein [Peribacillus deserti]
MWAMLKFIVDFGTMLIGVEGARLLREKWVKGDPVRRKRERRLLGRPRKASASRCNQQSSLTELCIKISI